MIQETSDISNTKYVKRSKDTKPLNHQVKTETIFFC